MRSLAGAASPRSTQRTSSPTSSQRRSRRRRADSATCSCWTAPDPWGSLHAAARGADSLPQGDRDARARVRRRPRRRNAPVALHRQRRSPLQPSRRPLARLNRGRGRSEHVDSARAAAGASGRPAARRRPCAEQPSVDHMAETDEGPIVAVDVIRRLDLGDDGEPPLPTIAETLARATVLAPSSGQSGTGGLALVLVTPEVDAIGLRQWSAIDSAVEAGRRRGDADAGGGRGGRAPRRARRPSLSRTPGLVPTRTRHRIGTQACAFLWFSCCMELEPRHPSRTHSTTRAAKPPKKPSVRQVFALAAVLCEREGHRVPGDEGRGVAAHRAVATRDGHPRPRREDTGGFPERRVVRVR